MKIKNNLSLLLLEMRLEESGWKFAFGDTTGAVVELESKSVEINNGLMRDMPQNLAGLKK